LFKAVPLGGQEANYFCPYKRQLIMVNLLCVLPLTKDLKLT